MTPTPIAIGLTLCEKAIVEEGTKNVTLVSTFTKMYVEGFPSTPKRFTVYAVPTGGIGEGIIDLTVDRLDTYEDVYTFHGRARFPDRLAEVPLIFRINNCSFPVPGKYQVTLLVDSEWIAQRQFHIAELEE